MSSSCVPPKNSCVLHDPDPDGQDQDDRDGDSGSECGSLCTCTSSSMTSIATSVANSCHPNGRSSSCLAGSSVSLSQTNTTQQRSSFTTTSATAGANAAADRSTTDANGNPYIVVFVPPALLPGRNRNCGDCHGFGALSAVFRAYLITACEFCPWVAGFVFIYYAFYWWGIGPGFTAFLIMMGSHALIRFLRARGESGCTISSLRQNTSMTDEENEENDEDNNENNNNNEGSGDASSEVVNESPPSYETAVGKPPPYDLYHHLTPTQPRSSPNQRICKQNLDDNFLAVPDDIPWKTPLNSLDFCDDDDDDDVFLPSYQDALRLSFREEKEDEAPSEDNGET